MNNSELYHYGVLGMKWGVRRYQNKDGSLTSEGKKRISLEYAKASNKKDKLAGNAAKTQEKATEKAYKAATGAKVKYQRLQAKADKAQYKADKKKNSIFSSKESYQKAQELASKLQVKADKYKYRAESQEAKATRANVKALKAAKKYDKWIIEMNKVFTSDLMKNVDAQAISNAKNFIEKYRKNQNE